MRKAGDVCFAEVTRDSNGALISTFLSFLFQLRGYYRLCLGYYRYVFFFLHMT